MTDSLDSQIDKIARQQRGNITIDQLRHVGASKSQIKRRLQNGRLYRVYRGVYSVGHPPRTPEDRAAAAALACGPGAGLGFASAMVLWEYWRRWEYPLEVVIPATCDRRPSGIVVHRSKTLAAEDLREHKGVWVTSPERTIFDMTPRFDAEQLMRVVNDAQHARFGLGMNNLAELLDRHPDHPSSKRLRWFVESDQRPTRSKLEETLYPWCDKYGLPRPDIGIVIAGFEVDAVFLAERVILECDGFDFHTGRVAFETDRERDAHHLDLGFVTIRLTAHRLTTQPEREARRLRRILDRRRRER